MNRPAIALGIGIAVFVLWYFVVLELVWMRDGMGIALGVSLALNAALLFRAATSQHSVDASTDQRQQLSTDA